MDCANSDFLKNGMGSREPNERLFIDAGVGNFRLRILNVDDVEIENIVLPSNRNFKTLFAEYKIAERFGSTNEAPIFITGKLSSIVRKSLGNGFVFLNAAAQWLALQEIQRECLSENETTNPLAMLEISASGYSLVGIDANGKLKDDLLTVNPRCGAGTGINIDRVLQKLGLKRDEVDGLLQDYLGEKGRDKRRLLTTRADRCGVFGASATISDKNQGIPLAVALATTLKSETLKVCQKLPAGFPEVWMIGRFFYWQFVRDCAEDFLRDQGVSDVFYDPENTKVLDTLVKLTRRNDLSALTQPETSFLQENHFNEFPPFSTLLETYTTDHRYCREASPKLNFAGDLAQTPLHIGLDVGSTMAKVVMADNAGELVFVDAFSNAGDTISTVKKIFAVLSDKGIKSLQVRSIGITGSARYQVQEALTRLYPELASRIAVLVENYAHARGSIDRARAHLSHLKNQGIANLNEDFCVLVDIGGEDTKISTLALKEGELFNNAMNIKCSAGTGSLMDTLAALFEIGGAAEASGFAMNAPRSFEINATCAVFLMENAQKLQAQGIPQDEILASANWAIVENMARTLWSQLELPANSIVLLHGQTMLSDPLPLAVTHRLQDNLDGAAFSLIPPYPGHRACIGLIRTMLNTAPEDAQTLTLSILLEAQFDKRIIQCKGAACDDPEAVCNRTSLKCQGSDGQKFSFTLGGCSAINELLAKAKDRKSGKTHVSAIPIRDSYREIWQFIDAQHPKSEDANRLVIPRSFVVSEWAYFLSQIFEPLGIPVYVDNVQEKDLRTAQPLFDIDSCAPHMGAVGQFSRIASEPHGYILAAQIEKLPTNGKSLGRSCSLNQGGIAVARGLAQNQFAEARICLANFDFSELDAGKISDQCFLRLTPIFEHYGVSPTREQMCEIVEKALVKRAEKRAETAALAAKMIEEALANNQRVALVLGREYLLNPGIYDSQVRRLLRDKDMLAIPSYILDISLDEKFGHIYWRNPHVFASVLHAIAEKKLYQRIGNAKLAKLFQKMEEGEDLLPVVQISTFCCGPDSVTLPLMSELMKQRPFLLIQSDAIIKELAHLENRVNTYVRQLELGLHGKLKLGEDRPFTVETLKTLENNRPLNAAEDVIYIPTLSDNRTLTSVLRGAGFTCIDNYQDGFGLENNVKNGRKAVGDSACAPMAGVYADLMRACDDFSSKLAQNDPQFVGKKRLLFFDNAGQGPCRQGQYVEVHKLLFWRDGHKMAHLGDNKKPNQNADSEGKACGAVNDAMLRFLVAHESEGYNFGLEEWTMLRLYQGAILQGVLHDLLFRASIVCQNNDQFTAYYQDFLAMKQEVYAALEAFNGPKTLGKTLNKLPSVLGMASKYVSYRLNGADFTKPIQKFVQKWQAPKNRAGLNSSANKPIHIHLTGEAYMRVALSEDVFRNLLSILGFGRFQLEIAPIWAYLDYLVEEVSLEAQTKAQLLRAQDARQTQQNHQEAIQKADKEIKKIAQLRWTLRNCLAKPIYDAAQLPMPKRTDECIAAAAEIVPTLSPQGEMVPFAGEILLGLREGGDLFLNAAPTGCMVSAAGQVLTPRIKELAGEKCEGRVAPLFSADGEIDNELLAMSLLKTLGPERFFIREGALQNTTQEVAHA